MWVRILVYFFKIFLVWKWLRYPILTHTQRFLTKQLVWAHQPQDLCEGWGCQTVSMLSLLYVLMSWSCNCNSVFQDDFASLMKESKNQNIHVLSKSLQDCHWKSVACEIFFFSPLFWNLAQLGAKSRQVFWPTWWLLALSSIPVASPTSPTSTSLRRCGPWRRRCGRWRCGFWSWWRRPKSLPTMSVPQLQAVADDGGH